MNASLLYPDSDAFLYIIFPSFISLRQKFAWSINIYSQPPFIRSLHCSLSNNFICASISSCGLALLVFLLYLTIPGETWLNPFASQPLFTHKKQKWKSFQNISIRSVTLSFISSLLLLFILVTLHLLSISTSLCRSFFLLIQFSVPCLTIRNTTLSHNSSSNHKLTILTLHKLFIASNNFTPSLTLIFSSSPTLISISSTDFYLY